MTKRVPQSYLTIADIADQLGCSRQAVHKQFKAGKLPPAVRWPAKPTMFREKDVAAWIARDPSIRELVSMLAGVQKFPGLSHELLAICKATIAMLDDESCSIRDRVDVGVQVVSLIGENHHVRVRHTWRERFRALLPGVIGPDVEQEPMIPRRFPEGRWSGLSRYGVPHDKVAVSKQLWAELEDALA